LVTDKYYLYQIFLLGKEVAGKKKLSIKTRLILIAAMFAIVNVVFFATESLKDNEEPIELSDDQIIEEEQIVELEEELDERLYYKFNPPSP